MHFISNPNFLNIPSEMINERDSVTIVETNFDPIQQAKKIIDSNVERDPFIITDLTDVWRKYIIWKKCMPNIRPFYAVKCNANRPILEVLAALGTGFDCASLGEMKSVLDLGVSPDRIIFANTIKMVQHIQYAAQNGIKLMTFDCINELEKIKKHYPTAKLVLRLGLYAEESRVPIGSKFGCSLDQIDSLLRKASDLGFNIEGVSFHIGSMTLEPEAYARAITAAALVIHQAVQYGHRMSLLDIGGGFPGETGTNIEHIAEAIKKSLEEATLPKDVAVIAEPGRYFVASASMEAVGVVTVKEEQDGRPSYYMNDGVYGSFYFVLRGHCRLYEPLVVRRGGRRSGGGCRPSRLWGPTCEPADLIADALPLPPLDPGDWLLFPNMGAYTVSIACSFNGFHPPRSHYVMSHVLWCLLKGRVSFVGQYHIPLLREESKLDIHQIISHSEINGDSKWSSLVRESWSENVLKMRH